MSRNGKRLGFLPDWRIFTYVILAVNVLFLVWIIAGASAATHPGNCAGLSAADCQTAANVGAGIGVTIIIVLWVLVDIILGVLYLVTNRGRKRDCPACGVGVKRGLTACRGCGYDFRTAPAGGFVPSS